jgi:hypothetical protein
MTEPEEPSDQFREIVELGDRVIPGSISDTLGSLRALLATMEGLPDDSESTDATEELQATILKVAQAVLAAATIAEEDLAQLEEKGRSLLGNVPDTAKSGRKPA